MDNLFRRYTFLEKKLNSIEYDISIHNKKVREINARKSYCNSCIKTYKDNIKVLKTEKITVSLEEYKKVDKEYAYTVDRLRYFDNEQKGHLSTIEHLEASYKKVKIEYEELKNTLNNRKVVLMFERKKHGNEI